MDDNSSESSTLRTLKTFLGHPKVYIYQSQVKPEERMQKCRYAHLINCALDLSQGDYITYLTDDDYFLPHRFEMMVQMLERPYVDVVCGYQYLQYGDDAPYTVRPYPDGMYIDDPYDVVDHNSVMHTREVFKDVGYWTENPIHWRGADGQYWRKIRDAGYKFWKLDANTPTEVHRFHTASVRNKLLDQGLTDLN